MMKRIYSFFTEVLMTVLNPSIHSSYNLKPVAVCASGLKFVPLHGQQLMLAVLFVLSGSLKISAQPAPVKQAAKSVFSLTTFSKGELKATSRGVFVSQNGDAVSPWTPFVGADSAVVVDAEGHSYNVETMIGCNELYDVCKFHVNARTSGAKLSSQQLTVGTDVWALGYAVGKVVTKPLKVSRVEKFMEKYSYYVFKAVPADNEQACPVADKNGQVLGLWEKLSTSDTESYSADVRFPVSFEAGGLSINEPALRQTGIRVQLPSDRKSAYLALMVSGQQSTPRNYEAHIHDFISMFPDAVDGYSSLAQWQLSNNRLTDADATMKEAMKKVPNKDEVHYEYSRLMMRQQIYAPDSTFTLWSLDKALEEAQEAYKLKPQPAYLHQQAQILYTKGDFKQALNLYTDLLKTDTRGSELYFEIAQCKTQLKAPQTEVLQALDSAVALCPRPLTNISAPYFLARGSLLSEMKQYRNALKDFNQYDTLMLGRATADFYEMRFKVEVEVRQYQQALNDIAHAIYLNPREPVYLAEMASLELRVSRFEDAVKTADLCLQLEPKSTDAYIIKGLALIELKKKDEGIEALQKAQELGDARAEGYIKKYK